MPSKIHIPLSLKDISFFGFIGSALIVTVFLALRMGYLVEYLAAITATIGGIFTFAVLSRKPGVLLLIYLLTLPGYILSMSILFKLTESVTIIRLVQPYKEALAIILFIIGGLIILLKLRLKPIHVLDILILMYFGINLLFLFVPQGPDLSSRFYGLRANSFFVILYFLGRTIPLGKNLQKAILFAIILIGALAGIVVLIEITALPKNWPVTVGMMDYLKAFFGVDPRGHYGLTWTFETSTGLRRYAAFFSNPLELASSTLITGVAALYVMFYFPPRSIGRMFGTVSFGLIGISLLLAISRASLIAFFIQIIVVSVWLRKPRLGLFFILAGLLGVLSLYLVAKPEMIDFVWETITFQNTSSQGHLEGWKEGLQSILSFPLGLGLATSGHAGSRIGGQIGGENQFIIIGVELGILGVALYIAIVLLSILWSLKAYRITEGVAKALCFVAAASKFGLLIPSFTANIEIYTFAMFITWWLVGFSIQQLALLTSQESSQGRLPVKELSFANRS